LQLLADVIHLLFDEVILAFYFSVLLFKFGDFVLMLFLNVFALVELFFPLLFFFSDHFLYFLHNSLDISVRIKVVESSFIDKRG
jgi:hypothetical protein